MAAILGALALVAGATGIALALYAYTRSPQGANRQHRQLLDDAAALLRSMRTPTDLDRVDVLSDPSKKATDRWLTRYNKEFNR